MAMGRAIDLLSKTITLHVNHAFLYISLPLAGRQRRENAYFHVLTFSGIPKKSTPGKNSPTFIFQLSGINATKFEKMRIYFKSDVMFSLTSQSSMLKLS